MVGMSKQTALYVSGFCAYASSSIVFPIIAPYAIFLGASETEAGIIAGGFALTTSLTMMPLGLMADRYGRFRMIVIGMLIFILTPFFYASAANFTELFLARLLHGLAMALFVPASNALAIDLSPERRGEALGWIATFTMLGYSFGPIMGGFVASTYGFVPTFYFCSLVALVGLISLFFLKGMDEVKRSAIFGEFKKLKPERNAIGAVATPFFATFGSAIIGIFAIPLYLPKFGVDVTMVGTLTTALFLASAIVRVPAGKFSDRIGRKPVILLGLGLEAIGVLGFLSSNFLLIVLASIVTGIGMGMANPAGFALLSDIVSPKMRGFAMGASSTSLQLGVFMGPAVMGFVADAYDYPAVFILTAGITIASALSISLLTSGFSEEEINHGQT
ncbi:MAG: MFS transporter [Archaeoglobus sp.]|nr:MFS transporter [Archaeoglobus sp.]